MAERFDLDAIEADDALLDLLAAGGESAWEAAEHDPALKLLAGLRLAVEVEDELPVETIDDPESFLARCAALNPVTDPFARKMAARGMALGVAAVAALSVSGVAAAVTGDPLSPYEKVIEKVVEGLRPETSFPAEQLDGMPVVDKSKIVKVAKDFREKQELAKTAGQDLKDNPLLSIDLPPRDVEGVPKPPLARPTPPQVEKPTTAKDPVKPPVVEPTPPPEQPVDPPTSEPTNEPTEPTTPPPTEPTPTTEPTDPPSTPAAEPTDPPTNGGSTDNGSTGNPTSGETPGGQPSGNPTTVQEDAPAGGTETGGGETGGTQAEAGGTEQTTPTEQQAVELPVQDVPVQDKPAEPVQEKPAEPVQEKPAEPVQEKPAEPVQEKPAESAEELTSRVEQYFGKGHESPGKHSSGKGSVGYAKAQYATGKHSSGQYAEGKHAAIDRAHGSMASVTLRQILSVVNTPTSSG